MAGKSGRSRIVRAAIQLLAMRSVLRHYFPLTDDELRPLWADGLFSFDASVLLNVYGYSEETRDDLIELLEKIAERVRLPHQYALEYARDRSVVIIKQVRNYRKVEKSLQQIKAEHLVPKRDHPFLTKASLDAYEQILTELAKSKRQMEKLVGSDPFAERLLRVFEGRVGPTPSSEDLQKLYDEAKARYEKNVPPGFADLKEKGLPDAYGDYIGWRQLIGIAKKEGRGTIFVIDDCKEDWWRIEHERTVGPRPELLEEFACESGQRLHLYTSENFLRAAKRFMAADINDAAIEEVTEHLASKRASHQAAAQKIAPTQETAEWVAKARSADDKKVAVAKEDDLKAQVVIPTKEGAVKSSPADDKKVGILKVDDLKAQKVTPTEELAGSIVKARPADEKKVAVPREDDLTSQRVAPKDEGTQSATDNPRVDEK